MSDTELKADEVFCSSCGEVIKAQAEVCPECGVSQGNQEGPDSEMPEARKYELQKLARKSQTTIPIIGFLIPFVGYIMVGKNGLAILNILTLNYLLLGFIIVPFHTYKIIENAQDELARHGENW